MRKITLALSLSLIAGSGICQRDTTNVTYFALLGAWEATDAGPFETLVSEIGFPPPSTDPFRQAFGAYGTGEQGLFVGLEFAWRGMRSSTDSATARTSFTSMGMYLGYCVVRTRLFDLAADLGWRWSNYSYSVDQDRFDVEYPVVSYRRSSLSPGLFARYGGRFNLVLHAGAMIPIGPGDWFDHYSSRIIPDIPRVKFKGFLALGISYRFFGRSRSTNTSPEKEPEEELEE